MGAMSDKSPFQGDFDVPEKAIKRLSDLLKKTDLAEIELAHAEFRIRVKARESLTAVAASVAAPAPVAAPSASAKDQKPLEDAELHIIRSPFVGTFYRAPSPTSEPFVEEGASVSKSSTLCIVEAMKIMNEIEADTSGVIEKIYVSDGSPVDFNTALFGIRKA